MNTYQTVVLNVAITLVVSSMVALCFNSYYAPPAPAVEEPGPSAPRRRSKNRRRPKVSALQITLYLFLAYWECKRVRCTVVVNQSLERCVLWNTKKHCRGNLFERKP